MLVDESKISELLQKEIKSQVENKLKQIGRDTLKQLYKEVIREQVVLFLGEIKKETAEELNETIYCEGGFWKEEVLNVVKEKFKDKIDGLFDNDRDYY